MSALTSHSLSTPIAPEAGSSDQVDAVSAGRPAPLKGQPWLAAGARWVRQRRALITIIDQGVVSAANLATSVLLGRYGADAELGLYALALSLIYFLRGIQEQVISGPYAVYSQRRGGADLSAYTGSLFVHQAVMSTLTLAAIVGLSLVVRAGYGPVGFQEVALVTMVAAPLMLLRDLVRQLCFARMRVFSALAIDTAGSVVQVLMLAGLAASGRISVQATYLSIAVASFAAIVVWRFLKPDPILMRLSDAWADFRANWVFGRWSLASQLIGCSMPYILPWIVATQGGAEAAGLWAASGTVVGIGNMFVQGFCNYLSPRAAQAWVHGGSQELKRILWKSLVLFAAVLGSCCVMAGLFGGAALSAVYGPVFAASGPLLFLLSLNLMCGSLGMVAGNGLWAIERPSANFAADITALVVTVAGTAALTPAGGAMGSAQAMLMGTAAGALVRGLTLARALRDAGFRQDRTT